MILVSNFENVETHFFKCFLGTDGRNVDMAEVNMANLSAMSIELVAPKNMAMSMNACILIVVVIRV